MFNQTLDTPVLYNKDSLYSAIVRVSIVAVGRSSYVMMLLPKEHSGSVASLRTFRVLRALKTVAVVPGDKMM